MKNKIFTIAYVAIISICFGFNAQAQDECGCIKNLKENKITIPHSKNSETGLIILLFYCADDKFNYDYKTLENFIGQVFYHSWQEILNDFPNFNGLNDVSPIIFDWKKLSEFKNWEGIIKNIDGKIYLENNHETTTIKIVNIRTKCFRDDDLEIRVYMADK